MSLSYRRSACPVKLGLKINKRHVQPLCHAGRFAKKDCSPYLTAVYHGQSTPLNVMQDQGDSFLMQYNRMMKNKQDWKIFNGK